MRMANFSTGWEGPACLPIAYLEVPGTYGNEKMFFGVQMSCGGFSIWIYSANALWHMSSHSSNATITKGRSGLENVKCLIDLRSLL